MDELRKTFKSGLTMDVQWRKDQLGQIEKLLIENNERISEALRKDLGRPVLEAFLGDIPPTLDEVRHHLEHIDEWIKPIDKPTPLMSKPASSQIFPQPKGVVLIIGAWNFPFNLVLSPLAGAISAGCCCVIKPSEISTNSAALIADLIPKYLDPTVVKVINGGVPETTALLALPWDHIMYTGNGKVGKIVMEAASKHLTPVTLELGGKSPVFIDKDVNIDVACRRIVHSKHFNTGQICIAPDYALVHKDVSDKIVAQLKSNVTQFYGENPQKSGSLGRIVNKNHFNRIKSLIDSADGEIVYGGLEGCNESDKYIPPTCILNPSLDSRIMKEEIFGPVLPIIVVDSMDAAIDHVNSRDKPLALYIFSSNNATVNKILSRTSSGGTCVNDAIFHINNTNLPFGGVGPSGMGSYHGKSSFDTFTHYRSVMFRATWLDPSSRYPPYQANNLDFIKKFTMTGFISPQLKKALLGGAVVGTAVLIGSRL